MIRLFVFQLLVIFMGGGGQAKVIEKSRVFLMVGGTTKSLRVLHQAWVWHVTYVWETIWFF